MPLKCGAPDPECQEWPITISFCIMEAARVTTRVELYDMLWSEPTTKIAAKFGLSDVGLAKVCRKHDIPRPPRGYWAQRQSGLAPGRTPLPRPAENAAIEIVFRTQSGNGVSDILGDTDAIEASVPVSDTLQGCHPLVALASQELKKAKPDSDGLLALSHQTKILAIRTSAGCSLRALLIFDAVLRECERRAYQVSPGPIITLHGQNIGLSIEEAVDSREEQVEEADLKKTYQFAHRHTRTVRELSGRLTIAITEGRGHWTQGIRHHWNDTERKRLEEKLPSVLTAVVKTALLAQDHAKQMVIQAEARRQEDLQRVEAAQQHAERVKLYKAEKARFNGLVSNVLNYQLSRQIRDFIAAVRAHHEANGPVASGSDVAQWLDWASQHADRLDPLRISPPSILDERLEEEPRQIAPYWDSFGHQAPASYWQQRDWWNRR